MTGSSDGKIALVALIAFAAWLFVGLPLLYLPAGESHSLWVPTDSVGLYTLVLAVFTAVLAGVSIFQGFLLLRADKTARIAADAAKRSADSAFAAERARFFIVIESHNLSSLVSNVEATGRILVGGEKVSIQYRFQNYGKTPGIIKELSLASAVAPSPVDPQSHRLLYKDFTEHMIGANGSTKTVTYFPERLPNGFEIQAIGKNATRFWFYGRLYYDDVFGNHQVHKFYFRSVRISGEGCILEPFDYGDHNKST
jgi:hypothetical protein